jgi:membrane protein YqaA with SNARE-associated domain
MLFFLPFGIDALVIFLAARNPELFWIYPILATAGSIAGAAVTFWIGRKAGEHGLERFVSTRRLDRVKCKVNESGAIALAIPALLPPPFPLTPFILTCGALDVNRWRFFITLGVVRLLRFGAEAVLARVYGRGVLRVLQSDVFQIVVIGFVVIALAGTIVSAIVLWRSTHHKRLSPA